MLRDVKLWSDANAVLAQANQQFPDDVDLLYEQSMMAEKLNRLDEMERLLRKVIELKPDHHHAYNALGYSLAERNLRLPEAKQLIQKALELSPGEPFITDSLGWVEYRLGNRDEALRLLRGAYQSRPDPEIAAHLGEVLWVVGPAGRSPPRAGARHAAATAPTTCCARRWPGCGWTCETQRRPLVAPLLAALLAACAVGAHRHSPGIGRDAVRAARRARRRLRRRGTALGGAPPSNCRARPRRAA